MFNTNYISLSVSEVLKSFDTNVSTGYTTPKANLLLKKFGKNELKDHSVSWLHILLRQFKSAFVYILIIAAILTFFLGEKLDSLFISTFVLINIVLGFFQEFKSEQTLKTLKKYTNKRATVLRDGIELIIEANLIVPGDIVIIKTGDIVPADLRLLESNSLMLDESTFTGESVPVRKNSSECDVSTNIFQSTNLVFSGTTVVEGKGIGIVIATGKDTQFGNIAKIVSDVEETSSFEKQINKFSKIILFLILTTILLVFIFHVFFKKELNIVDLTIYSIALAIGVIPEAMPLVTTFSLSMGASKLAKEKVVVKRLSAIEDLGSIQILCTDKTGTITENKLKVVNVLSKDEHDTLLSGVLCSSVISLDKTPNNSFDLAILDKLGSSYKDFMNEYKVLFEIPFNPSRRRNSVLISSDNKQYLIVRGALESIINSISGISDVEKNTLNKWSIEEGSNGKRVLALAKKKFDGMAYTVEDEESNLDFVGLISFEDPIKESTFTAIEKAKSLGVTTKIITGDSPEVAVSVGMKVGIANTSNDVITGDKFSSLNFLEQEEVLKNINVFARVSPQQKHEIISLLQERYEVGFLGEGINDGPALKAAGVSIVVDNAADVSREVADIILLKHDLKVIVDGIELGRKTFVNVTNYIKATLASNFGNFYAMAFVTLMIDYLPMLPIQILLVNLLSDFPMISIATDNVSQKDILKPKSYATREIVLVALLLGLVSTSFDFIMFGIFKNLGPSYLQTYWFIGSILTELVLIYSIRTKGSFFDINNLPSKTIVFLTLIAGISTVLIPFTPIGSSMFKFIIPQYSKLLLLLVIVVSYFISTEAVKRFYYKYSK